MIVSVDPGNCAGAASWRMRAPGSGYQLTAVDLNDPDDVNDWEGYRGEVDVLVIEHPILQMGDLNDRARALRLAQDLAGVNVIEGRWIQALRPRKLVQYTPHEWKGSVPKGIMNARTLEQLTPEERRLVPPGGKAHNGIDAIGVGLKYLKSMGLRTWTL
jgi:hypothetical protein